MNMNIAHNIFVCLLHHPKMSTNLLIDYQSNILNKIYLMMKFSNKLIVNYELFEIIMLILNQLSATMDVFIKIKMPIVRQTHVEKDIYLKLFHVN